MVLVSRMRNLMSRRRLSSWPLVHRNWHLENEGWREACCVRIAEWFAFPVVSQAANHMLILVGGQTQIPLLFIMKPLELYWKEVSLPCSYTVTGGLESTWSQCASAEQNLFPSCSSVFSKQNKYKIMVLSPGNDSYSFSDKSVVCLMK